MKSVLFLYVYCHVSPILVYLDHLIYFSSHKIRVHYETSPQCPALQWLRPEQTLGKRHPYLFSQSQVGFFMTNLTEK